MSEQKLPKTSNFKISSSALAASNNKDDSNNANNIDIDPNANESQIDFFGRDKQKSLDEFTNYIFSPWPQHEHLNSYDQTQNYVISHDNFSSLVGNTPLVPIKKLFQPHNYTCQVFAKCEFRNPSGSSWDRLVVSEINKAKETGQLNEGIALATGGNGDLCMSLAWAGAAGDIPVSTLPGICTDTVKLSFMRSLGANVILSFNQDPNIGSTSSAKTSCLEAHIKELEKTSGVAHYRILPYQVSESMKIHYDSTVQEISAQIKSYHRKISNSIDMIVCGGDDKGLVYALARKFYYESKSQENNSPCVIIGVDMKANNFTDALQNDEDGDFNSNQVINGEDIVKWVSVTDAEAYDMARRLTREEGLMVGPCSGAVMAAAMTAIEDHGLEGAPTAKVIVVLPDSLTNTSRDFLSTDWMIQQKYYNPAHLESIHWWYDMALENISPPVVMTVPPSVPARKIWNTMKDTNTERAAVVDDTQVVVGVVTYDSLSAAMKESLESEAILINDICHKNFGTIDSKSNFQDLELLLQKYHWVLNIHRVTYYDEGENGQEPTPKVQENVIGIITLADFMKYKRSVENHHWSAYGMAMSDGIPSGVWVESFKEYVKSVQNGKNENKEGTPTGSSS